MEPHKIEIKEITDPAFNYDLNVYAETLSKPIPLSDLEENIKSLN